MATGKITAHKMSVGPSHSISVTFLEHITNDEWHCRNSDFWTHADTKHYVPIIWIKQQSLLQDFVVFGLNHFSKNLMIYDRLIYTVQL